MKKLSVVVLCCLALSVAGVRMLGAAGNDPKDEKAVTATMEAMAKATIAKDKAALAKIYSDDVTYSHSSGLTQNKAEVLKAFDGTGVTESLNFSGTTIRIYGPVALFKGVTDMRNGQPGKLAANHLNILWVLVKGPGPFGWQIVARQTTRIAEPAAPAPRTTSSR
jgi:ketosteroid isomerase-like protein